MAYTGLIPTKFQIERQLARMLESEVFTRKPAQAALLKAIVEIALNEGEVTGKRLREVVYGNRGTPSLLRVQVGNLEETTGEYYASPGENDLIHIYLQSWTEPEKQHGPAGSNYMPKFAYNPRNDLTRKYFAAYVKVVGGRLSLISEGIKMMADIVKTDSHYADAWAALGDSHCMMAMLVLHSKPDERRRALDEAHKYIEKALELAPNSWHSHAAKAFHLLLSERIDEAAREFSIARRWNRFSTELYPGFLCFLYQNNGTEATDLTESLALELSGEPITQALHGNMLIASGHLDEAEAHYREALELDPNNGMCHLGLSVLLKHMGRKDEAAVHFGRAGVLLGPENVEMWEAYGASIGLEDDPA